MGMVLASGGSLGHLLAAAQSAGTRRWLCSSHMQLRMSLMQTTGCSLMPAHAQQAWQAHTHCQAPHATNSCKAACRPCTGKPPVHRISLPM